MGVGMIGVGGGVAKMIANTEILGNNCEVQDDDPVVVLPPPRPAPEPGRVTVAASDTL